MHEMRMESLSVVIPAYNESHRIAPTIKKTDEYCRERFRDFEIIVVNDGSTDDTRGAVLGLKGEVGSLRYVEYAKNRGKGYAIRSGVAEAKGDLILISDADLSTPIEELEKMIPLMGRGCDIVIGSRAMAESEIEVRQPWWRESMGRVFNLFVRVLFPMDFRDTQCGFKLFKGVAAKKIFGRAEIDRFAYDVEVLYIAKKVGFKAKEVPVRWFNSAASKVSPLTDPLQMMKDLIKLKLRKIG